MKLLTSAKMFFDSGRKTKRKFSVKDGQRLLAFSQRYRRSAFICSILIQAIFPFLKRLGETKSEIVSKQRLTEAWLQGLLILGDHEPFNRLALNESIHNLRDVGDRDPSVKKVIGFH
jgi:hypothetical protein